MTEYEFTLKFRLPTPDADPESYLPALAEAGCDDALVGIGQPGRIALDFTREAMVASPRLRRVVTDGTASAGMKGGTRHASSRVH